MMRLHWATCSKKPPGHRFQYIPRMSCGSAKANQSRLILQDFADPNQGFQGIAVHWGQYLIHKRYYDFVFRSGVWICSSCTFAIYLDTLRVCPDKLQTHTHTHKNKPTAKRNLKLFQLLRPREKFHKTLPGNPYTSLIPLLWTWLIWLHGIWGMGDVTFRSPWGVYS